jgi:hypothetical protein
MVDVAEPLAVIDVGLALIVECVALAGPSTMSVPVLVTVPPPVAWTVKMYVPAATAAVVVSFSVVAEVGHWGGLLMLFRVKLGVTPFGRPEITEKLIVLLFPL